MSGRRLLLAALLAVAVAALAAIPLLRAAGRYLVEVDEPTAADAIVVLTGSYPDRILEAAALYREGWAPHLVLCREPENSGFRKLRSLGVQVPRFFELNRMIAEQLGVPPQAITVLERPAGSTFSEAELVVSDALRRGYRTLIIVTSKYHARRAKRIYEAIADGRLRIIMRPARDDEFSPERWWRDRASTRRVVIEYQKLLTFLLLDRWRLRDVEALLATPAPTPPR